MSINGYLSGMRTSRKIALALTLAVLLWLAWCLKEPSPIALTAVQSLPPNFIWGVSTSAFQAEGGALDSEWSRLNATDTKQDRYGTSVDFRHRYREDVALAHDLGVNTYRIGISWARVESKPGQIEEAELAYYDDLILSLKRVGIAPLITLDHFDYPGWASDQGGWANPKTRDSFVAYAKLIAKRYHKDVHMWITFNEAIGYIGGQAAIHKLSLSDTGRVRDNLVSAHRQTYDLIHKLDPTAMVTSNIAWAGDRYGGSSMNSFSDWVFLDRIVDKCDVIAVDYYFADLIEGLKGLTQQANWLWPPEPAGLYRALKHLQNRYPEKPILIAEIGTGTQDGQPRPDGVKREDALRDTVYWTQRARADGVNVIGYMVWSLTDNFEWGSYTPRFGLYTVNVLKDPTLKRIPTAAVPAYKEIIRNNGVASSYLPVIQQ